MKLTSPKVIEALMAEHHLYFNKRFGQNFLIDQNILNKIVDAADINPQDTVLEIGPGIGTLTQALAERSGEVVTVEIDDRLIPVLNQTLADYSNVMLVHSDFLKWDFETVLKGKECLKAAANLPYYVTTPIIMSLLESDLPFEQMTFLVQKEVGERICSQPGTKSYGSLSIAAQFYADAETAFIVPAGAFMPRPKVDSAVITLKKREAAYDPGNKKAFFSIVKAAFLNRRKTLINSLSANTTYSKEEISEALEKTEIDPRVRAEKLSGEDFARLTAALAGADKYQLD